MITEESNRILNVEGDIENLISALEQVESLREDALNSLQNLYDIDCEIVRNVISTFQDLDRESSCSRARSLLMQARQKIESA